MCTPAEQRSDRNGFWPCFSSTGLSITSFIFSPHKGLSTCQKIYRGWMQQRDPDPFVRVSRSCIMSRAEHPQITTGVIIIIFIPEASKGRGREEKEREVVGEEEQAAWVGTLLGYLSSQWHVAEKQEASVSVREARGKAAAAAIRITAEAETAANKPDIVSRWRETGLLCYFKGP